MPFALAIIGIAIFVTAIRGTTSTLFGLIRDDFTGSGNFIYWVISLLVIGSIGYIEKLRPFANAFLTLVMVVLFIGAGRRGFFTQFMSAVQSGTSNCPSSSSDSSPSLFGGGQFSLENLLGKQATDVPAPVQYQPGQTLQQQLQNMEQNLNSAFGTSSTLGGG
jgi:hypothetical protein